MIPAVTDKYNRIDTLEKTGCSRITALGTRANHYWHVPSLEAAFTWRPADQIWVQAPMWHFRVDIDINETLGPASYVNEDIDPWIEPSFIITRPWIYEETFVHHLFSSFFFCFDVDNVRLDFRHFVHSTKILDERCCVGREAYQLNACHLM